MKTHLIYNLYFRAPCTARPLGTSSISFSENKESSTSLSEDKEKRPEENEAKAEVNADGQKSTEMNECTELSNATSTSQLEPVVKPEDSKQVEKTRSGKESLLELLGAMKVEVTTVRKIRPPKTPRMSEKPDQEPMESAHSMFQHATAQGSQQQWVIHAYKHNSLSNW